MNEPRFVDNEHALDLLRFGVLTNGHRINLSFCHPQICNAQHIAFSQFISSLIVCARVEIWMLNLVKPFDLRVFVCSTSPPSDLTFSGRTIPTQGCQAFVRKLLIAIQASSLRRRLILICNASSLGIRHYEQAFWCSCPSN